MSWSGSSLRRNDRGRGRRVEAPLLLLLAACAVGLFSDRGALLAEPWSAFAETGTPFVLVAFAAGRSSSRSALAALWGATVLTVGLAAYYAWLWLAEGVLWGTLTYQYGAGAWLAAGAAVGALVGAVGSGSRSGRATVTRASAWGLIIATPLAEGIHVLGWQPIAGILLLVLAATLYAWAVRWDRAPWQLAAISLVAVAPSLLLAENFRHLV